MLERRLIAVDLPKASGNNNITRTSEQYCFTVSEGQAVIYILIFVTDVGFDKYLREVIQLLEEEDEVTCFTFIL